LATFEAQVDALTGVGATLSSSTVPKDTELDQFLKDGVLDVTRRCIEARPNEAFKFQRTVTSDSNGVDVQGATIIGVMREASTDGSSYGTTAWRSCTLIDPTLQSRVVDSNSLYYASIYNPVYTIDENKAIYVFPVPSSDNGIKVFYVNNVPLDQTNGVALAHTHNDIKYFPNDKVYLVVLYAAIKSLESKLSELTLTDEDIELSQSLTNNLTILRNQYESAFVQMRPQQRQE
tara:strand:+ start:1006 stop:1704 length:699 start_codon:yes stop_codon:yes gene_type:complete